MSFKDSLNQRLNDDTTQPSGLTVSGQWQVVPSQVTQKNFTTIPTLEYNIKNVAERLLQLTQTLRGYFK